MIPLKSPPPNRGAASLLALLLLLACAAQSWADTAPLNAGKRHYVIWKMDDVKGLSPGFQRLADWLAEHKMKASFGVICNSLEANKPAYADWLKKQAIENGGLIEFWNHGYDHQKNVVENGKTCDAEFKGTSQAFQTKHLADSNALWKAKTGLVFQTFGAPYNTSDAETEKALEKHPELKIWLYGPPTATRLLVLRRSLNLECATGTVSYETFMQAYQKQPQGDCLVLQGHPGKWDDASFDAFQRIAGVLAADKWEFVTPREYRALMNPGK